MADSITRPIAFEEFERMPDEGRRYELRHGELVQVPPPKHRHHILPERLVDGLRAAAGRRGHVTWEFGFRALPEGEYRIADVGYTVRERWEAVDPEGYFHGSPEMVIEILSPSNTRAEIEDKRKLCLETGCREFWLVDGKLRQVDISTPDGSTKTYRVGQEIPLGLFGERAGLRVGEIFP